MRVMKRFWLHIATILAMSVLRVGSASAQDFSEYGKGLTLDRDSQVDVHGFLRLRGEWLHNLDLDHGLTPSGRPLYPVPVADPRAQSLTAADIRLRTDLSMYAPFGSMRVNVRLDALDNLALGSTPQGTPVTTASQLPPTDSAIHVERVYGEALTPFGVIAAGRMGNTWGLGMLANGGDCLSCDSGDTADRVALVTSQFDHFIALAYDIAWSGPFVPRKVPTRVVDVDPSDDVSTVTAAILRRRDAVTLERRMRAERATFDYGALFSFRWQENDFPLTYLPTTRPVDLEARQVIQRDFRAQAFDVWCRLSGRAFRIEAEAAVLRSRIEEASLIPGVRYGEPITALQWGGALQTEFGEPWGGDYAVGVDAGVASGDAAYGFGATPGPGATPAEQGDLDGVQIDPPYDTALDNFRFHPDYRIDQILFREIIGTVTDAFYLRPHMRWRLWNAAPGSLTLITSGVFSSALFASSTPGASEPLGVEIDPSLRYTSRDGFDVRLDYALLIPLSGLDNLRQGIGAKSAQLLRLRLIYGF